jgi:hypothetical protein
MLLLSEMASCAGSHEIEVLTKANLAVLLGPLLTYLTHHEIASLEHF